MPNYLITGCNRGLGLEIVRQLSASPTNTILACVRTASSLSSGLSALVSGSQAVHILEADMASTASIATLHSQVTRVLGAAADGHHIDYLVNNAGVSLAGSDSTTTMTADMLQQHMQINVLGPAKVLETLLPFLGKGSLVVNMSSTMGSCGRVGDLCNTATYTTYAISKSALNMLTVQQALQFKDKGITVVSMCPGHVKTDLGGEGAPLEPAESIEGVLKCIHGIKEEDTGKFYEYSGSEVPW